MSERVPFFGELSQDRHPLAMSGVAIPDRFVGTFDMEDTTSGWFTKPLTVLVVRREGEDLWEPPTDVLRENEGLRDCLHRIVLEQAGVETFVGYPVGIYQNTAHPQRPVTVGWKTNVHSELITPGPGIAEVDWMPPDEAPERMSQVAAKCVQDATNFAIGGIMDHQHNGYKLRD